MSGALVSRKFSYGGYGDDCLFAALHASNSLLSSLPLLLYRNQFCQTSYMPNLPNHVDDNKVSTNQINFLVDDPDSGVFILTIDIRSYITFLVVDADLIHHSHLLLARRHNSLKKVRHPNAIVRRGKKWLCPNLNPSQTHPGKYTYAVNKSDQFTYVVDITTSY